MSSTLSSQALTVIDDYLKLPFQDKTVSCPYYNNKRRAVRGALRVLIGKGTPEEITQEAMIFSLKEKIDLVALTDEQLKTYLVKHGIGIDCSGLVYHVLDAELRSRNLGGIKPAIHFSGGNILRRLIRSFRTVENTDVSVLADDKNSHVVALADVQPGDLIVMKETGLNGTRDHILLIHKVENQTIHYTHSLAWSSDGAVHHGVRQGTIAITDLQKSLLEQQWEEQGKKGEDNETFRHAQVATSLEIRRLNLMK